LPERRAFGDLNQILKILAAIGANVMATLTAVRSLDSIRAFIAAEINLPAHCVFPETSSITPPRELGEFVAQTERGSCLGNFRMVQRFI
jgi:hypothetical protein